MAASAGELIYTVGMDTKGLLTGAKEASSAIDRTSASAEKLASSQTKASTAVSRHIEALRLEAATAKMSAQQKELYVAALNGATDAQLREISALREKINALNSATGSNNRFRGGVQQAGYQLQDLVVQLQMGTSAFVAFGQQGSQLAGAFGPVGAIVGTIIALAAAIAGPLYASYNQASTAATRLEEATKGLNDIIMKTDDGVLALTERIIKLSGANEAAARAEITLGMVRARDVINAASDSIGNATKSVDGWTNATGNIGTAASQLDALDAIAKRFGITQLEAFDGNIPAAFQLKIEDLASYMRTLSKEYGLTRDEALSFVQATDEFNQQRTPENAAALADMLAKVAASSQTATPEFVKFAAEVGENARRMTDAKDKTDALRAAQDNLSGAIARSSAAISGNSRSLEAWVVSLENSTLRGAAALKAKRDQTVQEINNNAELTNEQRARALKAAEDLYKIERSEIEQRAALHNQRIVDKAVKAENMEEAREEKRREKEQKDALKQRRDNLDRYYKDSVNQAQKNRELQSSVDPVAGVGINYNAKLAALQEAKNAELITEQVFMEQKTALAKKYESDRLAAAEQVYKAQSEGHAFVMDSLDALGNASTNAISGLLSGTMSVTEAMQNFANIILNQAVGALVEIGIQQVKNQILGQTAAAASVAAASAQGTALAAAYAPAAISANIATFGAAGTAGLAGYQAALSSGTLLAVAGARQFGGPTDAGMYRVGENNQPEIYQGGGASYLISGDRGRVTPMSEISGGSVFQQSVNVHNYGNSQVSTRTSPDGKQMDIIINEISSQLENRRGRFARAMTSGTNTKFKAR